MTSSDSPQGSTHPTSNRAPSQDDLAKQFLELKQLRKQVDELERLVRKQALLRARTTGARPAKRPRKSKIYGPLVFGRDWRGREELYSTAPDKREFGPRHCPTTTHPGPPPAPHE